MSDLLFAATAANDVDGVRAISQARRQDAEAARDALQNDSSTFTTVDDLEVAASAATAPTWLTAPLPPMPQRHAPDDACQMEASSEDEDACGSAWSGSEMMGEDIPSAAEDVQVKVSIDCKEITPMHPVRLTLHLYPSAEEKKEKDEEVDVVMQEDTTDEAVDMSSAGWAIYPIEIGCIEACETGEVTEEVHLEEGDSLAIVGTVRNRLGQQIVVEADPLVRPLDTGSVLFAWEGHMVGKVADIFGSVEHPHYLVHLSQQASDIPTGTRVYSAERFTVAIDLSTQELRKEMSESDEDMSESDEDEVVEMQRRGPRRERRSHGGSRKRLASRATATRPHKSRPRWRTADQRPPPPVSYILPAAVPATFAAPFAFGGVPPAAVATAPYVGFHPYNAFAAFPTSAVAVSQLPAASSASQPQSLDYWQTSHHYPPQI